jgi:hypothetical protein
MSASDAAPLPRLGEVFFDVRGSSRSMRLSWYSDTDVAVFSIWQGGMCTGTFRLPIGDLARMVEVLQRGPDGDERGHDRGFNGDRREPDGERARPRRVRGERDRREPDGATGQHAEVSGYYAEGTGQYDRPPGQYQGPGRQHEASRGPHDGPDAHRFGPADGRYDDLQGSQRYREDYGQPELPFGQGPAGDDRNPGYQLHAPAGYESAGHRRDDGDYGTERFVPPYVRDSVSDYSGDIPARPAGRPAEPPRMAYRDESPAGRSVPADNPREPWSPAGYSEEARYRLGADGDRSPDDLGQPHSAGRHGKYLPPDNTAGQRGYLDQPEHFDALTDDSPAWRGR